jgi:HK97 family phage major capsid protein
MITETLAARAALIHQAREIHDRTAGREPNGEERAEFDRLMTRSEQLLGDARKEERERSVARRPTPADMGLSRGPLFAGADPNLRARIAKAREFRATPQYRAMFMDWALRGEPIDQKVPIEYRDTIVSTDTKGGFLVTPTVVTDKVVRLINDMVWIRSLATVLTIAPGKSLGAPQVSTNMGDANWTTEVAAVTEDTTMVLSSRNLEPRLLSKLSKASARWMAAVGDSDMFLANELGYKFGITEEKAFLLGDGTTQPLGVFVASANGIPAGRDLASGNSATAIGADHIQAMKSNLKQTYRIDPTCAWLWSRDAVRQIMLLKEATTNAYLFQAATVSGESDRLLSIPIGESEYVPNTFTTGQYVGLLGAWRYYYIVEYEDMTIQRLTERFAATFEIGFIARRWVDGSAVVGEAFTRSKLA